MRRYLPLAGLILLVPVIALYLMLDTRRVNSWRLGILKRSQRGDFDLPTFVKAVSSYSFLPRPTLQAMLDSLSSG